MWPAAWSPRSRNVAHSGPAARSPPSTEASMWRGPMDELIADLEQVAPLLGMVSAAPDLGNLWRRLVLPQRMAMNQLLVSCARRLSGVYRCHPGQAKRKSEVT